MSNKIKIGLIDAIAPKGHHTINKFYLDVLYDLVEVSYFGENFQPKKNQERKVQHFKDSLLYKGRLLHFLTSFLFTAKYLIELKRRECFTAILLSYDVLNLFLIGIVAKILKIRLITFEHNTVPTKKVSIKYIFQYICSKSIQRICYTKEAQKTYILMGKKAHHIEHPVLSQKDKKHHNEDLEFSEKFKGIIFCPSASSDLRNIINLAERNKNYLFLVKTQEKTNLANIKCKFFFENYNQLISVSDFIYLPINFENRVSGPFYEALEKSKTIIVDKNKFGLQMKKKYNDFVIYSDEKLLKKTIKFNAQNHNSSINNKLREIIENLPIK
ncbi:hypothetical protein ACWJJH_00010 [Endozoicomonadaceae bacterium StTr2]